MKILLISVGLLTLYRVNSDCSTGQKPCGNSTCYDPELMRCDNSTNVVSCIRECNGTCYSTDSYCVNGNIICDKSQLVCNVSKPSLTYWSTSKLTCYDANWLICTNGALCHQSHLCGSQCLNYSTVCVNNETLCTGFDHRYRNVNVCGSMKNCYNNATHTCINNTTVCPKQQSQLCGSICIDPTKQVCLNGTVRCINSCNGTCYSNDFYCFGGSLICNINESVCNVTKWSLTYSSVMGLVCYDRTRFTCRNGAICDRNYVCGEECTDYTAACVDNATICNGFYYWNQNVGLCGPTKTCYDRTTHVCVNNSIVCRFDQAVLCGNTCLDSTKHICVNGTVRCINSCNGICYSNDSYCFGDSLICNKSELACNVTKSSVTYSSTMRLICYSASQLACKNGALCNHMYVCGEECLNYFAACVNNATICYGYHYMNQYVRLCGPRKTCYDSTTHVCANSSKVCSLDQTALCGNTCMNPTKEVCINGTARCINSCNGTCYSNDSYCFGGSLMCNINESVCNVTKWSLTYSSVMGLVCYDRTRFTCRNGAICDRNYVCGEECLNYTAACVNNATICNGFYYWNQNVRLCGPTKTCYDRTTHVCVNNSIVCRFDQAVLCGNTCLDSTKHICVNGTVRCINSCNGICYSNDSYCVDNRVICRKNESVCNVVKPSATHAYFSGLICYDPTWLTCRNGAICDAYYACGKECLNQTTACANETICNGFSYWNQNIQLCGRRKICFDTTTDRCINNTTVCPLYFSDLCGGRCFDVRKEMCLNGTVQCINSCNGTCYSNDSYCFDNRLVCSRSELVCNVSKSSIIYSDEAGLVCYNPTWMVCLNNSLCTPSDICGNECLDYWSVCVNNQTVCRGFDYWSGTVDVCGENKTCYDKRTDFCFNGTSLCPLTSYEICGNTCIDPEKQSCVNETVRCINSCNGICYSNNSYCTENKIICNKNELVCNVTRSVWPFWSIPQLTCYNSSSFDCIDNILCYHTLRCGMKCLERWNSTCVNNRTICPGFIFINQNVSLCGRAEICFDNTTHVCLGNSEVVCPIGYELCNGTCFDPRSEQCCNNVRVSIELTDEGDVCRAEGMNTTITTPSFESSQMATSRSSVTSTITRTSSAVSSSANIKKKNDLVFMAFSLITTSLTIFH